MRSLPEDFFRLGRSGYRVGRCSCRAGCGLRLHFQPSNEAALDGCRDLSIGDLFQLLAAGGGEIIEDNGVVHVGLARHGEADGGLVSVTIRNTVVVLARGVDEHVVRDLVVTVADDIGVAEIHGCFFLFRVHLAGMGLLSG